MSDERVKTLVAEIEKLEGDFISEGGEYGYGGEWFPRKEINSWAIARWVDDLLTRQAEPLRSIA